MFCYCACLSTIMVLLVGCGACSTNEADEIKLQATTKDLRWESGKVRRHAEGYLKADGTFVEHGKVVEYDAEEHMIMEGHYAHGQLNGKFARYSMDGKKILEGDWAKNQKDGVWVEWNDDGEKSSETTYRAGHEIGVTNFWADRHLRLRKTFDDDGNLREVSQWHLNSDVLECQGAYRGGEKHGMWKYFDRKGNMVGEWRNGKPWNGECLVPLRGDAGSVSGLTHAKTYKDGVEK
jgi:hypothetical protein